MPKRMHDNIFMRKLATNHNFASFSFSLSLLSTLFIVPPDKISIKDDTGVERSTVVGPYSEGDIITLSCEVFGGKCPYTLFIT